VLQAIDACDTDLSALCLCGGGIRSATFALGVMQALARFGLLGRFHYLSSVSGGGYIASWLTAWRSVDSDENIFAALNQSMQSGAEVAQITGIRTDSNYLTPQLGLLSADSWTLVTLYIRNLVLNCILFVPFFMGCFFFPRMCAGILRSVAEMPPYLSAVNAAVMAAATATPASASLPGVTTEDDRVCFPRDSLFQVTNVVAAAKAADGVAPNDTVTSNTELVSGNFPFQSGFWTLHWLHFSSLPTNVGRDPCADGSSVAVKAKTYDFTADQLTKQDFTRGGLTWDALVIPYKYYFTDRSFKSNASTVAFLGYEGWFPGVSLSGVVAAGAGLASSTQSSPPPADSTTPAATNSSSFVTYTMAVGVVAAFGDSKTVKAGLLFWRDYQGKDSGFKYENKTWMALSIGAGF
jgi:hypothetical protein